MNLALHLDGVVLHALTAHLRDQFGGERVVLRHEIGHEGVGQAAFYRLLTDGALVRQSHAVGRQHARERMDEDARYTDGIGDRAGMLAARSAEAREYVARYVIATLNRDLLDGVGHVVHGDAKES